MTDGYILIYTYHTYYSMKTNAVVCLLVLFVGVALCAPQNWFMKKSANKAGAWKRHMERSDETSVGSVTAVDGEYW